MTVDEQQRAPVEFREAAAVESVDFAQRIVKLIAVPYGEPAPVMYRGEPWSEIMERGAFDGLEKRPNRIRANRDHDRSRTVGKALRFWPDDQRGLIAEIRIGQTLLGDETLSLAAEDMLSASIGFAVRPADQRLDRATKTRHIRTAFLDHISFVEAPAYDGARVLAVRHGETESEAGMAIPKTPRLDQFANDEVLRWAAARLKK
jgi:HK97 family phage prohead protease